MINIKIIQTIKSKILLHKAVDIFGQTKIGIKTGGKKIQSTILSQSGNL
jgi:hypothetical protein